MSNAVESSQDCVIGLDIGATKTAAGLVVFPRGEVLYRRRVATRPERGGTAVLAAIVELAWELAREAKGAGLRVAGIGAGVAELVDHEGRISSESTFPWRGTGLGETLSEVAPALVESDVRAAALGEALFGAGRDFENLAYVTVGSGISHCLVVRGQPYAGAHGSALLLGSAPITHICEACGHRTAEVLEHDAAGPGIARQYAALKGLERVRCEDVVQAAEDGEPEAVQLIETSAEALGARVALLINLVDPQAVIVGGGLGASGGLYWRAFVAAARAHIWFEEIRELPILTATLGENAGVVGAAAACRAAMNAAAEGRGTTKIPDKGRTKCSGTFSA